MGDKTKKLRWIRLIAAACALSFAWAQPAHANPISALSKVVAGVLQIPVSIIVGTATGPPIIGTLMGAVNGAFKGVGLVAGGALELGMDGVALAKMAAPYVLPFLL